VLCKFQMIFVESWCRVVTCCPLTVKLQLNLASLCVGFMVNEWALKHNFFSRSYQISLSVQEDCIFTSSCITASSGVWQHWAGSTLSPLHIFQFLSSLADDTCLFTLQSLVF
jgi:hypothetical protein